MPRSQLEIGKTLKRTPGEIYRMLMCLEERGYVVREPGSGKFRLTLRLYELGHRQHALTLLREAARLPMEELAEKTGQGCHLSVQYGPSLLVLMERMPARRICLAVTEGTMLPMVETSSGMLLISRLKDKEVRELLDNDSQYRSLTRHKRSDFLGAVENVRKRGFLVKTSELNEGVTDIAVPVGVAGTGTASVLAVSYLAIRGQDATRACCELTLRSAARINENLGITP